MAYCTSHESIYSLERPMQPMETTDHCSCKSGYPDLLDSYLSVISSGWVSVSHHSSLSQVTQHHDAFALELPDHSPEISDSVWQRSLGSDVCITLLVTLQDKCSDWLK